MSSFDLRYEGRTRILTSAPTYPQILEIALDWARRYGRAVEVVSVPDGIVRAVVRPDGSVSASPSGHRS